MREENAENIKNQASAYLAWISFYDTRKNFTKPELYHNFFNKNL